MVEPSRSGLATLVPLRVEIEGSVWNNRAWIYQELALSTRLLFFTDSQMYFQCNTMNGIPYLQHPAIDGPPLVSTIVDDSTWRRVGASYRDVKGFAKKQRLPDIQDYLKSVDLGGIWGVRKDWELRTLCLI
jgi:hypothetical protein